MSEVLCTPVIKWLGGKRQLLPEIVERLPKEYGTYFEPFFGGGALFFELQPKKAVINDVNNQLINLYQQIKKDYTAVVALVDQYQRVYNSFTTDSEKGAYYYSLREAFNEFLKSGVENEESAALFLFLNKAGFNGLYRINARGELNVASAHRKTINAYQIENIRAVSEALRRATILQGDFSVACQDAQAGDFVFFDSPYYDTFDRYQSGGFDEAAHRRLAALFKELTERGVKCMLTNSNTDLIKGLYSEYNIEVVNVMRRINCDVTKRTGQEVIITNYTV